MVMRSDQLDLTKDEDILTHVQQMRSEAETGNQRHRERMRRCRRFRVGDQWDKDVENWYRSGRKHALTINRILPTVLQVAGVHAENRKDITARPTRGGTGTASRIISSLLKHTLHGTRYHHEHNGAFLNAIGDGAGYLYVDLDFHDDPKNGNLGVRRLNPFSVWSDPSVDEYNLNKSGRYIIWDDWEDEEKAKLEFPDKAEELTTANFGDINAQGVFAPILNFFFGNNDDGYRDLDGEQFDEHRKHKVRITHTFWKEWRNVAFLYRVGEDELEPLKLVKEKDIAFARKLVKEQPNKASMSERIEPVLHHTKSVGDVFLEDVKNPWAYKDNSDEGVMLFPIIPIYAYFEDGYIFSIVENLISPQEEHNFSRSTLLNIWKKLANTGWIGKNMPKKFMQWLSIHSGEDGVAINIPEQTSRFEKIEPTQIPSGPALTAEQSKRDIAEIASVKLDPSDFSKSNLTNQARALKERDTITASNTLFANDEHSVLILGEFLTEVIRNTAVYSDEEIKAVVDEEDLVDARIIQDAQGLLAQQGIELPQPPVDIQAQIQELQDQPEALAALMQSVQQELETFQDLQNQYQQLVKEVAEQIILEEIRSLRVGKYGMMVDEQPHSPTIRMENYAGLLALHQVLIESNYPGIPRDELIKGSDVPNKDAILAAPPPVQPQEAA